MTPTEHYQKKRLKLENMYNSVISEYLGDLTKDSVLVDIGSGKLGAFNLEDPVKFYKVAIDIDEKALLENVLYDERILADARTLPFENELIDVIISRDCFEHIQNIEKMFSELRRVMKPGGILITITPNYLYLKGLFAKAIPPKIQNIIWEKLKGRDVMPYPVFFEINTVWKWKKFSKKYEFDISEMMLYNDPLHWFVPYSLLYWLSELFHIILKLPILKYFRSTMFVVIKFN